MEDKDLFKLENLMFASSHDGEIGSLYFFNTTGNTCWRGRIRLSHFCGPTIEKEELFVWEIDMINASEICISTLGKGFTHESRGNYKSVKISQACIDNLVLTLSKSYAKLLQYQKEMLGMNENEIVTFINNNAELQRLIKVGNNDVTRIINEYQAYIVN